VKDLVRRCGLEGRRCLLLLEDHQVFDKGECRVQGLVGKER
jgi:hypothetical protein